MVCLFCQLCHQNKEKTSFLTDNVILKMHESGGLAGGGGECVDGGGGWGRGRWVVN